MATYALHRVSLATVGVCLLVLLLCCPADADASIQVRPLSAMLDFGAEVVGADLRHLDNGTFDVLAALRQHGLLLFRGQELSPDDEANVYRKLDFVQNTLRSPFAAQDPSLMPTHPFIRLVGNVPQVNATPETNTIGFEWHSDGTGATSLYALRTPLGPPVRTTLFASAYAAYNVLTAEQKAFAQGLRGQYGVRHAMEASVAEMARRGLRTSQSGLRILRGIDEATLSPAEIAAKATNSERWKHFWGSPVRRHPDTGRNVLWCQPVWLEQFEGYSVAASRDIMEDLMLPGTAPDKVYTHEWQPLDFVLWDNRAMFHSTTPVVPGPQLFHQVTMRGKKEMAELPGDFA